MTIEKLYESTVVATGVSEGDFFANLELHIPILRERELQNMQVILDAVKAMLDK